MSNPIGGYRKWVVFSLIYLSYCVFYYCRKNYAFWMNELITQENYSKEEVSMFGSVMELSYGISKSVAGIMSDFLPPAAILYSCLFFSAISNGLMFRSYYIIDLILWGVNGFFQSFAWPALAVIFMNWFKDFPYRGTLYSLLSTSQNIGSATTPIILTPLVAYFGWKSSLWGPMIIGVLFSVTLYLMLEESPPSTNKKSSNNESDKSNKKQEGDSNKKKEEEESAWKSIFYSKDFWYLGLGYAFITFIRVGMSDWYVILLRETHGFGIETARNCIVICELGSFIGGIVSGFISDFFFSGKRKPVIVLFTLLSIPSFLAIILLPMNQLQSQYPSISFTNFVLPILYFYFGFMSFVPHMMIGLYSREIFPLLPSTAASFIKLIAQIGAGFAGYPTSLIVSQYGWEDVGICWGISGVCALFFLLLVGYESNSKSISPSITSIKQKAD